MSEIQQEKQAQILSPFEEQVFRAFTKFLQDPTLYPKEHKAWLTSYLELNPPLLPISQIAGFSGFTAQSARVSAGESTTSGTYAAITGPDITGLPAGQYLVLFGASNVRSSVAGGIQYMGVRVNSTDPTDAEAAYAEASVGGSGSSGISAAIVKTLTTKNNSLSCRYRVSAGTGSYANRFIIALRISNA